MATFTCPDCGQPLQKVIVGGMFESMECHNDDCPGEEEEDE